MREDISAVTELGVSFRRELIFGVAVGVMVFVVLQRLTGGVFPAISFGLAAAAAWLVARRN